MKANRNLKQNDEAVSPVIGVILMVAITVILAAVIGAFVFGMGPPEAAPQMSLRASQFATNGLTVEHQGGDIIQSLNNTKIMVAGTDESGNANVAIGSAAAAQWDANGGAFSVGQTLTITGTTTTITDGIKIVIVDIISQKPIATFTARM